MSKFNRKEFDHAQVSIAEIKACVEMDTWRNVFHYEVFTDKFVEVIKSAQVFVDAGAEFGYYAFLALKYMPEARWVHLFEPEPARYAALKDAMSHDISVYTHPYAVSSREGDLKLYKPSLGISCTVDPQLSQFEEDLSADVFDVPSVSLDSFFEDINIDVLKMDIEGAEALAFPGMKRLLEKGQTRIFIELHEPYIESLQPGGMATIKQLLDQNGYRIYGCKGLRCDSSELTGRVYLVPPDMVP